MTLVWLNFRIVCMDDGPHFHGKARRPPSTAGDKTKEQAFRVFGGAAKSVRAVRRLRSNCRRYVPANWECEGGSGGLE